jgi:hypothetical protein
MMQGLGKHHPTLHDQRIVGLGTIPSLSNR